MEKRYQVFISSTKEDLEHARAEVSQALLKANCFPAAMELFPAADEGIDDYIKQKIDESDYLVLIIAGRYGSVNPKSGKSYTEEEYDYAVEKKKPIIRLVHKNPFEDLPGKRIEQDKENREKLLAFRGKVTNSNIVRFYSSDRELGAEVILGIMDAQQRHPSTGWVRADEALGPKEAIELGRLREELAEIEVASNQRLPEELEYDFGVLDIVLTKIAPDGDRWDGYRLMFEIKQFSKYEGFESHEGEHFNELVFSEARVVGLFPNATKVEKQALVLALLDSGLVERQLDHDFCFNWFISYEGLHIARNYPLVSVLRD